jgi:hypothetical protein
MSMISFWVRGNPQNLRGFCARQGRPAKPKVDLPMKLWKESVMWAAIEARANDPHGTDWPPEGPVAMVAWFWLPLDRGVRAEYARTGVRPMPWRPTRDEAIASFAQLALDGLYDVLIASAAQVMILVAGKGYCLPEEDSAAQFTLYSGDDLYAYAVSTPPVPADRPAIPAGTRPPRWGPYRFRGAKRLPGSEKSARPPLYWFDGVRLCRRLDSD